ncbi:ThiF family adenylyltransferase [Microbispora sp. RL4-1S]|uniref:ThiF family adenylyltransferase n=1 Tax=Microbispora oryzae TaxID=2806554 RepID=A0A940WPH7_9ACTN|nr:ThiF family adenylyltransferase [Microbispora oryzae]MBP2707597.1 ThiF family adenylyltransferase [Microbispora oryzae]
MRPRLKAALRRVERDPMTLQFGVHPLHTVVLTDVDDAVRRFLDLLDGTRGLGQAAAGSGLGDAQARELVDWLAGHGLIEDAAVRPAPLAGLTTDERDRLRPELGRLSLVSGDGGMDAMARRRAARVRLYGAGRVGARIAALLAAAGVGHLCVVDPGTARPEDVAPGGLVPAAVGLPREQGAVTLARQTAPGVDASPGASASHLGDRAYHPDLVVLAPVEPLDPALVHELTAEGVPHLLVTAFEGRGSVGPLVLPGLTPCLRCLDLARRDRDPAWPMVCARLGGYPPGEISCDVTLSCLVAAQAAGQALSHLDGTDVTNITWDVSPDWRWHRRTWKSHPECDCGRKDVISPTMVA